MYCESRSSEECPGDQSCFAYVTECASADSASSGDGLGGDPTSQPMGTAYNLMGAASNNWQETDSGAQDSAWGGAKNSASCSGKSGGGDGIEGDPYWFSSQTLYGIRSSSSSTRSFSLAINSAIIISSSLLLCLL